VAAALASGHPVERVYTAPNGEHLEEILATARGRGIEVQPLADGVIESVADTSTPQPVLAVVRIPECDLRQLDDVSLVVVLAGISDPGNAGTIVRVAEGSGATAVVFGTGSTEPFSPKAVRASAGAVFQIPIIQGATTQEALDVLGNRGVRRLGTAAGGGEPYDQVGWQVPTALVLGNEAWGVPEDVRSLIDGWVTIPMAGRIESLNVAMAASVLLFEALRARTRGGDGQ